MKHSSKGKPARFDPMYSSQGGIRLQQRNKSSLPFCASETYIPFVRNLYTFRAKPIYLSDEMYIRFKKRLAPYPQEQEMLRADLSAQWARYLRTN